MDRFVSQCFKYYCDELLKYRDKFTDEFFKDMKLITEGKLSSEIISNIDEYRTKMFAAIDCLAVLVNFYLDIPRKDSRKFVVNNILRGLSNDKKIALVNFNDRSKFLIYDTKEMIFDLDNNSKALFELYSKLHLIGSDQAFDF